MAGGMARRRGPTLAERRTATPVPRADPPVGAAPPGSDRVRPVVTRHCWVVGLPDRPGRWAGLLAEWRQAGAGWQGRVVYALDDDGTTVLVEAWLPAAHLEPAR
jgi:hypothetical protein